MDCRMQVLRWTLVLVTFLTWFEGMGLALTSDGLALMEFRNALTTISPLLESWNASDPSPCSWGGITCTDSGHVQDIILPEQVPKLEGHISATLGKLKSLEVLWLDANLLSGSIPPEIGNLSSLRVFSLSFQNFSGEIPLEVANCKSLVELWLNGNNFTGDITTVLEKLSKLSAIEKIGLDNNAFTGTLPPSLGNATTLTYLSFGVSNNSTKQRGGGIGGQIPKELGKLRNLTTLWLAHNSILGDIPQELGKLTMLEDLDLGYNNLSNNFLPMLQNITSLNRLLLAGNKLNGTIPSYLATLVNLTAVDLSNNNFVGKIPLELGNLANLIEFAIFNNNLSGPIPISFTSLVKLRKVFLCYNELTGSIPIDFSKTATSLEEICLQNNSLSGPIPMDFGRFMPNLTSFSINYNFFNGTLPDRLCQGGKLQWLGVGDNNLEGAIPQSLAHCTSLNVARLRGNKFTSIPIGFGSNYSLYYLDISRNQLSGPLPIGLGRNGSLAILDLSENMLTGGISVLEYSQLAKNLSILNLAKNNFIGEIPTAMAACKLLFRLDLSYNFFSGSVPLALANLSILQELRLQSNNLTTFYPTIYSGFATTLRILDLAENPWNTSIALEIGSLRMLHILNLSYGGFTGPIPSTLGQLTQLEVLDLSNNNLTGEVPSGLGVLMTSLVSVNVSFNRLTGSLPPEWVKFLLATPASFRGNPGLCLHYNANNICMSSPLGTSGRTKLKLLVRVIVGMALSVTLALVVFVAYFFGGHKLLKKEMASTEEMTTKNLTNEPLPFSFEEIMKATEYLSDAHIIGKGGHGVVYKVKCASNTRPSIAVKKIEFVDLKHTMFHKSYWSEVETVGQARHRNLVRLLGFIKRDKVGLLLYDYVSNGDLHSALHNPEANNDLLLTWKARLCIAQGVAHGLAYLHHDYDAPIVHRDIKSSNVLLDDDLEAHISDFGLAKVLDIQTGSKPWLSTQNILGTYGYIAPEVGYGKVITSKVDVYSYGVLLLELLTRKKPVHDPIYGETSHIVVWVKQKVQLNQGKMTETILDPSLLDPTNLTTIKEMLYVQEIALMCTRENPTDRPTMRDIENMLDTLLKKTKITNGVGKMKENLQGNGVKNKCSNGNNQGYSANGHTNQLN